MVGKRHDRVVTTVDGCEVVWRCHGEGPAVVLLHGGHGNWRHWARNIGPLSHTHRVLVPDMPGFGDSGSAPRADLAGLVDVLARALVELPLLAEPIDIVGFSFGALVAAYLASHAALGEIRVRSLALLGPAGHGGPRRLQQALIDWRRCGDAQALASAMRHNLRALMISDPTAIDSDAMAIHTRACRATRFHTKSISRTGALHAALARYRGPVLMLWGEHDVTVTPETIRDFAATPWVEVSVVVGAGHWVQYEADQQVNGLLQAWLRQQVNSVHRPA